MSRIFISYRREDSAGYAGRLYDRLSQHFGADNVFMDIDAIPIGMDFVEVIEEAVGSCDVLIALIGQQWLTTTDAQGRRRLDNPEDFVRLEIKTALDRNIRVIPALIRGASMPRPEDLPDVLQKLARRNALEISDRFHQDVDRLIKELDKGLGVAKPASARFQPVQRRLLIGLLIASGVVMLPLILGVLTFLVEQMGGGRENDSEQQAQPGAGLPLEVALDTPTFAPSPTSMPEPPINTPLPFTSTPTLVPKPVVEPEMVLIPAGEFLMGSDPGADKDAGVDEQPQHTLYLPDFYIAKTEVTNAQYAAFVQATGHEPPSYWENNQPPSDKLDHPVVEVDWHDAVAYCEWLSKVTGRIYRLPTEAEWEKAARGTDGRIYPWGNQWDESLAKTAEGGPEFTTPVGAYPDGASPYGVLDMAGNVWEWTATKWKKTYPYDVEEDEWTPHYLAADDVRVLRGGSWLEYRYVARCASRYDSVPHGSYFNVGFRLVSPN